MAPRQRRKNLYFLLFSSRDLLRSSLYHRSLLISPYVNCSDSPDSIQILCCYAAVGYRSCIFKLHTAGAKKYSRWFANAFVQHHQSLAGFCQDMADPVRAAERFPHLSPPFTVIDQ